MAETSQTEQKRPIRRRKGPASFRTQAERLCQWVPPSLPIDPNGFTAGGYPFGPCEPPFCQRQLHATVDPMKTPPTLRPSKRRFFIPLALTAGTALVGALPGQAKLSVDLQFWDMIWGGPEHIDA